MEDMIGTFPWLTGLEASAVPDGDKDAALRRYATAAIERRDNWYLPVLAPFVPASYDLADMALSARPANRLRDLGAATFGDLESVTVRDLFAIRHMGAASVHEIVTRLFEANVRYHQGGDSPASGPSSPELDPMLVDSLDDWTPIVPAHSSLAGAHLETLAHWSLAIGRPDLPLVSHQPEDPRLPAVVRDAAQWLHQLSAVDVPAQQVDVASLLNIAFGGFDERQTRIVEGRLLSDPPETLDTIGKDINLTRERVRQLMARLQTEIDFWLSGDSDLGHAAAGVRYQLDPITPLSVLLDQNVLLKSNVDAVDLPAWYVLDKLDDEFESDGVWVAKPSLEAVAETSRFMFADYANTHGAATITDTLEAFNRWSTMRPDDIEAWLTHLGFSFVLDYVFSPDVRSIPERAAAYLSMVNVPQTTETIHAATCPDKSLVSLRNQLTGDPDTFARTGRSTFGLKEWGLRQYTTVRDAIGELIDQSDAGVALDDVIHDLSSSFGLAPASVAQYAHAWPYEVVDGFVRRAAAPPQSARTRSVAEIRNVYHHEHGILFRAQVTQEHLRGSGTNVSSGLAQVLGVRQGQTREFSSVTQPIKVSWTGLQPSIGSTRQTMTELDAAAGSLLRVVFRTDGHADIQLVNEPESLSSQDLIGALLDLPSPTYASISSRLGIAETSSRADVLMALRSRGESDLADLIADPSIELPT